MQSAACALLAAAFALLSSGPAPGAENQVFRLASAGELERGTTEGIAIGTGGSLSLAPALRPILPAARPDIGGSVFWCLAVDESGTVWIGGGGEGQLIRIPAAGQPGISTRFREPHVTAIAADPKGGVVAGTSPNGMIYSVRPGAAPAVLFDPDERYIWSLQFGRDGTLYAGTGERGRIYAIPPSGEGRVLFDGDDPHVLALALDRQARLIAGTAGRGRVIRFGEDGSARTLFDSNGREITGLAVDGAGNVLIGALAPSPSDLGPSPSGLRLRVGEGRREELAPEPAGGVPPGEIGSSPQSPPQEITAILEEGAAVRAVPFPSGPRSEIVRLGASGGSLESLWSSSDESLFALFAAPDGTVYAATGDPAGIRRIELGGNAPLLVRLPESQVTALAADREGALYLASSNAGNAYRLGPGTDTSGTFTSRPLDAGFTAHWGAVSWEARTPPGARITASTRTGSSPDPDSTWSPWTGLSGDGQDAARVASPDARFLQIRLEMSPGGGASPRLQGLTLNARPFNRTPVVSGVEVPAGGSPPLTIVEVESPAGPPDDGEDEKASAGDPPATAPGAAPDSGAKPDAPGETPASKRRWVTFESSDPDGDPLRVVLRARQAEPPSATVDVPLMGDDAGADALPAEETPPVSPLAWDDRALAEGRWTLLVRINDEAANPAGSELWAEAESPPFTVDRTAPSLVPGDAERGSIRVAATDRLSPIRKAEYSPDGKSWRVAGCADGILDQRTEQLLVPAAPGREVTLRVTDEAGNTATITLPNPARKP